MNKYDLNKQPTIFVSGDGGSWIKGFDIAFPKAIYVLDPFHYFNNPKSTSAFLKISASYSLAFSSVNNGFALLFT